MDASLFIGKRLRFKGKIVISSVAVSFFVIIIAVAVSSGFRHEIRTGLSVVTGDVQLTHPNMNILEEDNPVNTSPSYMPVIEELDEVEEVVPVVYRAAIVKSGEDIHPLPSDIPGQSPTFRRKRGGSNPLQWHQRRENDRRGCWRTRNRKDRWGRSCAESHPQ